RYSVHTTLSPPLRSTLFPYTTLFRSENADNFDGCVCDIKLRDGEATADAELPSAAGGVESIQSPSTDADAIDGCDIDFKEFASRSEEHTSELQSRVDLVCRLLLEKKK